MVGIRTTPAPTAASRAAGGSPAASRRAPGTAGRAAATSARSASAGRRGRSSAGPAARQPTGWPRPRSKTRASRARSSGSSSLESSGSTFAGQVLLAGEHTAAGPRRPAGRRPDRRRAASRRPRAKRPRVVDGRRHRRRHVGDQPLDRATAARRRCASRRAKAQRGSGSPGYHLPWPKCSRPPGAKRVAQALHQVGGEPALRRADGGGVPLGAVHVVDRHEGRLAAHRQAHVAGRELAIDRRRRAPTIACHCSSV